MTVAITVRDRTFQLATGGHDPEEGAACIMEVVAYDLGLPWSANPDAVSPVVASYCQVIWDSFGASVFGPMLERKAAIESARPGKVVDRKRAYLAADRAVRVFAPRRRPRR